MGRGCIAYTLQCATAFPKICTFHGEILTRLIHCSWGHPTHHSKQHLNQVCHFSKIHGRSCDRKNEYGT